MRSGVFPMFQCRLAPSPGRSLQLFASWDVDEHSRQQLRAEAKPHSSFQTKAYQLTLTFTRVYGARSGQTPLKPIRCVVPFVHIKSKVDVVELARLRLTL